MPEKLNKRDELKSQTPQSRYVRKRAIQLCLTDVNGILSRMVSKLAEISKLQLPEYSESFIENSVHSGQDTLEGHEIVNIECPMCCTG